MIVSRHMAEMCPRGGSRQPRVEFPRDRLEQLNNYNYSNTLNNEKLHFQGLRLPGPDMLSGRELTHLEKHERNAFSTSPAASDIFDRPLPRSIKTERSVLQYLDDLPKTDRDVDRLLVNTSPLSENELPIKKRKQRVTDSNSESGDSTITKLFPSPRYFCELTASSNLCYKCKHMRKMEALPGPTGKFNNWNSLQVQQWLLRELKAHYPEMSSNIVCCLLQKLEGRNGIVLSTYTRKELRKNLDSIEGYQAIYDLICEKLASESQTFWDSSDNEAITNESVSNVTNDPSTTMVGQRTRTTAIKPRRRRDKCVGQLWEFIYNLLEREESNPSVVTWENKEEKLFRIVNTEEIARLWGDHKGNKNMTYANMSRTMRYYREGNGAFVRNDRKRVYGFGPKADFQRLQAKLAKRK
ncbi:hypothetical protein FOCC_FOCC006810 [Frankliniella occidentalis]|nr:hypothetical protein FOCC_FOCC006810 [Frankliniella occidentalis]